MSEVSTDSLPNAKKKKPELVLLNVLTFWHTKLTVKEVAKRLRVQPEVLMEFVERNKLPRRPHDPKKPRTTKVDPEQEPDDPTPDEIAERAAECRAWREEKHDDEKPKRGRDNRVEIRQYAYSSRTGIFTEM